MQKIELRKIKSSMRSAMTKNQLQWTWFNWDSLEINNGTGCYYVFIPVAKNLPPEEYEEVPSKLVGFSATFDLMWSLMKAETCCTNSNGSGSRKGARAGKVRSPRE